MQKKREGFDGLYHKFNDRKFQNSLFDDVDPFWESEVENHPRYLEDPFSLIYKISYRKFMEKFLEYFDHPDHPDVLEFIEPKKSEYKRIDPHYLIKYIKEAPGNMYNRQTLAWRQLLSCFEAYSVKKTRRRCYVSRDGYSKASGLVQDLLWDKDHKPKDYWGALQQVKDVALDQRYWFGIKSDVKARKLITKIQMTQGGIVSYICYGPRERRGTWKVIYKFPRDCNFFAKNSSVPARIHLSRDFNHTEYLHLQRYIEDDIKALVEQYCKSSLGEWKVPDEDQMKISFHTPGALAYLKESKTAYVFSNETPKDMMRRIKLEAKIAKEAKDAEENEKKEIKRIEDEKRKMNLKEIEGRKGDPQDLGQVKVVDSNPPDISLIQ